MSTRKRPSSRRAILEAAWRRLERGDPARLEDVAADAGVSRQAVYLHFGSRNGLLLALMAHIDAEMGLDQRVDRVRALADPVERLEATLVLIASFEQEIHGVALAFARHAAHDEEIRSALEGCMDGRRHALRTVVHELAQAGKIRSPWSEHEVVDALWELTAPTSFEHLVVERGWTPERYRDWLLWVARSFLC